MPSWLRVRAELRERMEGFQGSGFVEGRDDLYWLTRFRLNATITPRPLLSFQLQVQDARVAGKQVGPIAAPFKGPFDLRMAFADVGRTTTGSWSASAARNWPSASNAWSATSAG